MLIRDERRRLDEIARQRVLDVLGVDLGADDELRAAVLAGTEELGGGPRRRGRRDQRR